MTFLGLMSKKSECETLERCHSVGILFEESKAFIIKKILSE